MNAFELDLKHFHAAAEEAVKASSRTYPEFINGQSLAVAVQAIKLTEKANAGKIAAELAKNVTTTTRVSAKTGKTRTSRRITVDEASFAARIINARLVARGEKPIWGSELAKAARRMIGARLRAVAFIRSGWVYAIRTLSASVGYSARAGVGETAKMKGQAKGYARPATRKVSDMVSCEIGNTALIADGSNPMPMAEEGLRKALQFVARDMMEHLRKKLQPIADRHSAR